MCSHVARGLSSITTIACCLLISGSLAHASVKPPRIDELTAGSDLIVLARVDSVIGQVRLGNCRARATVLEVWKGRRVQAVDYDVTPRFECDISDAIVGETVLLFLAKDEGWHIAWHGRGRMPLKTERGKKYLTYFMDVIFPHNTRSIDFPKANADEFDVGVELKIVKKLVQKVIAEQRDVKRLQLWCLTFPPLI